jgi:hypothetical protein
MIVCENRACLNGLGIVAKKTGIDNMFRITWLIKYLSNRMLFHPFTVFLLRAHIHEFDRISRAIIHGAVNSRKLPDPSISLII